MALNDVQVKIHDLRHPLAAVEYVEFLQQQARRIIERHNGISEMLAFIALTRNPTDGKPLPSIEITMVTTSQFGLTDSGQAKQAFSLLVKRIAQQGAALMICFLSEAWVLNAKTQEDMLLAEQWLKTHDSIDMCPLRQDSVLLQVEHKALNPRHQLWIAPIHTVGEKRTVGEFVNNPNSDNGRFCRLLPD